MSYKVAEVKVGLKTVEIRAITSEIVAVPAGSSGRGVQREGKVWKIDNKVQDVGFEPGDRATLFWCARGDRESDWAAGYNHRTGSSGVSPHGLNELITPPFYTAMAVVAIFVGLFALFSAIQGSGPAILLLLLCIVPFVVVSSRHKKVKRAIETALTAIRQRESATPATSSSS